MQTNRPCLSFFSGLLILFGFVPSCLRAEYFHFTAGNNMEAAMQEVRWPVLPGNEYNSIWSGGFNGVQGETVGSYGGTPISNGKQYPFSIIWTFWSPHGVPPGEQVTAYWTAPNMYAPLHVGESASGKVTSDGWPMLTTNQWYRQVTRTWVPPDGTPNVGYAGRWIRDPRTTNWIHIATMRIPFAVSGMQSIGGFHENLGSELAPRRTDYRNAYYCNYGAGGSWQRANQFTCSTRNQGEMGAAWLLDNATAAAFSNDGKPYTNYYADLLSNPPAATGPVYLYVSRDYASLLTSNLPAPFVALGPSPVGATLTLTNQPAQPPMDPLVVTNCGAVVSGSQLLVYWTVPSTSSPQFSYKIEVFDNPNYTGMAALTVYDIDPEARQKLLDITGVSLPYARLTIVDIMYQTNAPIALSPAAATLSPAANVTGAVNGLSYAYYESATNFGVLPNFNALTPVFSGAADYPDLSLRRVPQFFAFNYSGYLSVPADGLYTFTVNSCDGSKLYIDGRLVVDWDGVHSPGDKSGWVGLKAGLHAVNLPYFYDYQIGHGIGLASTLTVSYSGPGLRQTEVPLRAWYRVPGSHEPTVVLATPADGTSVCGSNVTMTAAVTTNGAALSIDKVQFYVGNYIFGTDTTAPYGLNQFVWASPGNLIRARMFYNGTNVMDSAANLVGTTNMNLTPWSLAVIGDHLEPVGAQIQGGTLSLLGDGLNLLTQQVSGDCTVVGHVAALTSVVASTPDGQTADSHWEAGIMLRANTNGTPGGALGTQASAPYVCAFKQLSGQTHFQDSTMAGTMGAQYDSPNLGSAYSWFQIQRVGDTFTTAVSTDGVAWVAVNTNTVTGIGTVLNAGMFSYAATSDNPNVFVASLDNLSITGNILNPPSVSVSPAAATVYAGQSATFTASPSGNPPYSFQWQDNGVNLAGATNATLSLTNLQPGHSGLYQVQLTTSNGTASAVGTLSVLTPAVGSSLYPSQVLSNSSLVAYWRLGESGGTTAYDALGAHNGVYTNVILGTAGPQPRVFSGLEMTNSAAQFNGSNSYVNAGSLGLSGPLTITAWIKPTALSGKHAIASENGSYYFKLEGNNLDFFNAQSSGYSVPASLTAGVWQHVAVTYTPNTAGGCIFYQNGQLLGAVDAGSLNKGTSAFWLGKNTWTAQYFDGAIDEVAVFNRALSATEIENQYLAAVSTPPAMITLTNPASGTVFIAPATISLAATTHPNGHAISKVQFYNGMILLGEVTNAPYNFAWTDVSPGTYTIFAQALYDGTNAMSSVPAFVSVAAWPSTPTGLTATPGGWQVGLVWTAASHAASYNVKRSVASGGPYTTIANVTTNNYLDGDSLMYATTYYYVVSAVNAVGESANSSEVAATPVNTPLADAYVQGGSASNFGTDTNLVVKLGGGSLSYIREAYLMFDVSALAAARSVKLQLMPVALTGNPTLGFDWVSDDTWTELGINWTNAPGGSGMVFTNLSNLIVGVPVWVDVTAQAKSQATQNGVLSLHIYCTTPGSPSVSFGSKEQPALTHQPHLVATFPAPPPAVTNFALLRPGGFTLSGLGQPSQPYVLMMASNLLPPVTWTALVTNPANAGGVFQLTDPQPIHSSQRFYRVKAP